ncbi:DUF2975 domain-containing protein [Parenemella sanctibonifatiensis]|nr:DUF2975 domain-containing protein [Parenemella sanctibonifatiensis]
MNGATKTPNTSDLTLIRGLLVAIPVLVLALRIVPKLIDRIQGNPLTWSQPGDGPAADVATRGGATVSWSEELWQIPDPSVGQVLGSLIPDLALLAVSVAVAVLTWRLIGAVTRSDAFEGRPSRSLRIMALVLAVYAGAQPMLVLIASLIVLAPVQDGFSIEFLLDPLQWWALLAAAVVAALAEVYRQGERLRQDSEGLV